MRAPGWVSIRRSLQRKAREVQSIPTFSHFSPFFAQALKSGLHGDPSVVPHLVSAVVHGCDATISAHNHPPSHALLTFRHLHRDRAVSAHLAAVPSLLSAAAAPSSSTTIAAVHGVTFKLGMLTSIVLSNSLLSALSKSCPLSNTLRLFDEIPATDLVSQNTMLAAYARAGDPAAALHLFGKMPEADPVSWTTMVTCFTRAGDMAAARATFDAMPVKNAVSWAVILSGYAERGMAGEAAEMLRRMEESLSEPDDPTMVHILGSCRRAGALHLGERVHRWIERRGNRCGTHVWNALIDMYSKCGDLSTALRVFYGMGRRDSASWNAAILALAAHGHGEKAVGFLSEMERAGFRPDKVTFIGVLCGCTHAGLVEEGVGYLKAMGGRYGVTPEIEHYGCVVDLLGRRGLLREAFGIVYSMPFVPNRVIWSTLLRSCEAHDSPELADVASRCLSRAGPSRDGAFVVPSDVDGSGEDSAEVVSSRSENERGERMFGGSSIEVESEIRVFGGSSDGLSPNSAEEMLRRLSRHVALIIRSRPHVDSNMDGLR